MRGTARAGRKLCTRRFRASCPPKGMGSERTGTHAVTTETDAPPPGAQLCRQAVSLGVARGLKSCWRKPACNLTSMKSREVHLNSIWVFVFLLFFFTTGSLYKALASHSVYRQIYPGIPVILLPLILKCNYRHITPYQASKCTHARTRSCYIAWASLQLTAILPRPPK